MWTLQSQLDNLIGLVLMLQLKVVGPVAVLGGLFQIVLLMFLCGVTALVCAKQSCILAIWNGYYN